MTLTKIASTGVEDSLRWVLGANGQSDYTFTGPGLTGTVNDPTIYLTRGHTYIFQNNNAAGAHPFYIKTSIANGGTSDAYNTGVTNNGGAGGTEITFTVPHDSPDILYYQCSSHANMAGQFNIAGSVADGSISTTKLADDAVNNDKLADSVVAAIAANTAKTSNATHTGDVTGSTNLTIATNAVTTTKIAADAITNPLIADDSIDSEHYVDLSIDTQHIADQAVDLTKLPHGTSSNDGKFLRANNGADPSFETVSSDVVNDTSPQLGGALDTNEHCIDFGDSSGINNDRLKFGDADDLQIYHNGNNSEIADSGAGDLRILTNKLKVLNNPASADELMIQATENGAVELYHDNEKKLFTTANGVDVQAEGSAVELRLKHSGGTLSGYVYGNNSNQFGFLDAGGNWPIQNTLNTKTEFRVGSTKKLTIDSDGLKFGSDTSANNALHDYEEGTYSPQVGRSSGHVKTSGYTTQQGTYTKIGRLVHCTVNLYFTNGFGGSGYYWLVNLPFTPDTSSTGSLSESCSMVLSRLYVFSSDRAGGTNAMTFKMQSAGNLLLKSIKDNSWHTSGMGNIVVINGSLTYYTAA